MPKTQTDTTTCAVCARGEATKRYDCGHDGPTEWDFILFGNKYAVVDERRNPKKCGQCHLDEVQPLLTQCARCKIAIGPGEDCIMYGKTLCCLGVQCGPGPLVAMPGIWDGKQFVNGLIAGTVKTLR